MGFLCAVFFRSHAREDCSTAAQVLQKQLVKLADLGSSQDNSSRRFSRFSSSGPRVNIPGYKFMRALTDGDSFGELSMLFDRRRTATVVAATILELASLSKADFVRVIQEFPELAPEFEKNIGGYALVSTCSLLSLVTLCQSVTGICCCCEFVSNISSPAM